MNTENEVALAALHKRFDKELEEITEALSQQLGYGNLSELNERQREAVDERAEELINEWNNRENEGRATATTPLEKLLAQHHATEEAILDLRDQDLFKGNEDWSEDDAFLTDEAADKSST